MDIAEVVSDPKAVRQLFLGTYGKEKKYGNRTIKAFLHSIKHFYDFIVLEYPEMFKKDLMDRNRVRVNNWIKGCQSQIASERHLKDEHEVETEVAPGMPIS